MPQCRSGMVDITRFDRMSTTDSEVQVTNVARIASRYHIQSPINYDTGLRSNLSNAHALHLLIPASKPSANLCRTILSLNILRYPPPTLLNLRKGHDEDMKEDPTEKITAVHSWLQQKHIKDDDLVLLIDGYDTWFQVSALQAHRVFRLDTNHHFSYLLPLSLLDSKHFQNKSTRI